MKLTPGTLMATGILSAVVSALWLIVMITAPLTGSAVIILLFTVAVTGVSAYALISLSRSGSGSL
jgi:hypothetical protein